MLFQAFCLRRWASQQPSPCPPRFAPPKCFASRLPFLAFPSTWLANGEQNSINRIVPPAGLLIKPNGILREVSRLTKPGVEPIRSQTRRQNAKYAPEPQPGPPSHGSSEAPPEHALDKQNHDDVWPVRGYTAQVYLKTQNVCMQKRTEGQNKATK